MILQEFWKYGRRFRGLILLYIGWLVFTTVQAYTHGAFPTSSNGVWPLVAQNTETTFEPISMVLLVVVIVSIWLQDPLWEPCAFWPTRPASRRDHLSAKLLWLIVLGGIFPAIVAALTSIAVQATWAETMLDIPMQGCSFLALASVASGIALVSRQSQDVAIVLCLHLPGLILHGLCWHLIRSRGDTLELFYVTLVAVVSMVVLRLLLRVTEQRSAQAILVTANSFAVPLIMTPLAILPVGASVVVI